MRRPFVDRISFFGRFTGRSDTMFELGDLFARGFQFGLNGKQDGMHLLQVMLKMSHSHFEIDQTLREIGIRQDSAFFMDVICDLNAQRRWNKSE